MEQSPDLSMNRELVEFYVMYKLSQRNFPVDHIRLSAADRTEGVTGGVADRTEGEAGGGANRTAATGGGAEADTRLNGAVNGSSPPPIASAPEHTAAPSPLSHSTPPPSPRQRAAPPTAPPTVCDLEAVKEALRDSANEFELRFSLAFSDLHRQLHITPATAYRSFESVMDEVFRDGVNWGRVVGLFAFGGALCVECVEKEMSPLVARIVDWMTVYLDQHIQDWITAQGGWARFAEVYGQDAAAESRRSQESLKKWLWAGMTLVTGVVVGSLIAQKRL